MINIIVAFPKMENAKSIKSILVKSGFSVHSVCTTGAQTLQQADAMEEGIVVCAGRMQDMMYPQLREYLPSRFQMLVIASPRLFLEEKIEGVVCLAMPLKVHELAATVEMMSHSLILQRKKKRSGPPRRSPKEQKMIEKAKEILMARNHMTEQEAHRYLQKCSMDSGNGLAEAAQMIMSMLQG